MTPESPSVVPQTVGNAFVQKYYNQLYEKPAEVYRFYLESSVLGRPGPDGDMVYAKSLKEINDQIMSLDYQNSRIQILYADSQASLKNGVVTLVTGLVIRKDGQRTKFSQSFFLLPQKGSYYVLNDSLRYLPEEFAEPEATEEVSESAQVIESTDVISAAEPADETVEGVIIPTEPETASTKTQSPVANGHVIDHKEKVVRETTNIPKAAEAKPQEDAPRRSYAVIVRSLAQNSGQFNVKVPPAKPKHVEKPRVAPEPKAPAPKASSPRERPSAETSEKAGSGSSIFVAKLPMDATREQLYETFKDFGAIKKNGIQVKSYTETRNCFGFVAFESGEAAKSVLQAHKKSAIMIGNRRISIEEKRGNNHNNSGRSYERNNNYYRNENGYRNDGYRPRGNGFSGGRGNGRNGVERWNGEAAGDAKASEKNGHGKAHAKN